MRTLAIIAIMSLSSCVPQQAITQAENNVTINRAHASDQSLSKDARLIAQDNADAWEAQLYILDIDRKPSAETRNKADFKSAS